MSPAHPRSGAARRHSSLALFLLLCVLASVYFVGRHRFTFVEAVTPSGNVYDEHGNPLAGACVRFKGENEAAFTGLDGRFRLTGKSSSRITASLVGYLIAGIEAGRSPLVLSLSPLPTEDSESYAWVDPAAGPGRHNCANCHQEMFDEWAASSHARSATGRHFRNLYEGTDWDGKPNVGWSLLGQYPEGSGVCTSCHAPTVPAGDPASFDLREVKEVAARGVHCDYCHKVVEAPLGRVGLTHGRDGMRLLRPAKDQLFFGPLDDVDRGEDSFSPLYRESRYCASCHEGTVFGVHVYGTYSEWLESPARREGKQCQTCHMTPTGKMTNFAPGKGGIERNPSTLASHRFEGGQLDMLRRSLKLTVTLTPEADQVRASVEVVADQVGHRVPTGFIDRNLLLVVEPLDADGKPVDGQGPRLPPAAGRDLAGKPGRLYAKLLLANDGRSPEPFWKTQGEVTDTRIVPGQPDRNEFLLPPSVRRVRVRLIYRRFWAEVAEVKGWTDNETSIVDRMIDVSAGGVVRWSSE